MHLQRTGFLCAATIAMTLFSNPAMAFKQCGKASWYQGPGAKTANGERLKHGANTAAHRTLPFGARVKVTNRNNGRSIVVRINDRGPFIHNRVIDVTRGAAQRLGFIGRGVTNVCITRVR